MAGPERGGSPKVLRWIASLLLRSPDAAFIVEDLEELYERDVAGGMPRLRARWRYGRNLLGSVWSVWGGGVGRRGRGGVSWLDFKLGIRMLVKYPGLTVVGGLAMAFAIGVGAGMFEFATQLFNPMLPLPDGDRIVGIQTRDVAAGRVEPRVLHDFVAWRDQLETVDDLGAYRTLERNLVTERGGGEPVEVAAISASAFRVAQVPPLLGRTLIEADERPGAPPVALIGYGIWRRRFDGDPDVVGRTVRVGSEQATVIGVMPEGFAFPVNHGLWIPLRLNPLEYGRLEGPGLDVFGRLAPGATLEAAQAELATFGRRAAAAFPETHEHLRPFVMAFPQSVLNAALHMTREVNLSALALLLRTSFNIPVVLFLILVCGNVALLMFARAATRENEIVVRTALGASRGRIIGQLFVEALVLGAVAAAVGLALVGLGMRWALWIIRFVGGPLPFWVDAGLSPATLIYTGALTVLCAAIAGVVPGLKVTRGLGTRLRRATAGGGGFQFGGLWTVVVVSQIAVTIPIPIFVWAVRSESAAIRAVEVGFPENEYLAVRLELDPEGGADAIRRGGEETIRLTADDARAAFTARFQATTRELERRLASEPAVAGVTFADRLPRTYHPARYIEVDEGPAAPLDPRWPAYRVSAASVAPNFFDVLGVPMIQGRGFQPGDLRPGARPIIVNQSFVDRVLGGRNPIGRRVRYAPEDADVPRSPDAGPEPWYEIVGVVRDLGMAYGEHDPKVAGFYHPVAPGSTLPARMVVHVRGEPASFTARLHDAALAVGPALRLHDPMPMDRIIRSELRFYAFWFWFLVVVTAVALTLTLAGIYAVMAFTVAQRTREVGIRVALGADRQRIIAAVFRRPFAQVGLGVLAGGMLLTALAIGSGVSLTIGNAVMLAAYVAIMTAVCMLAWIVPTRRALRIEPMEALRAEG